MAEIGIPVSAYPYLEWHLTSNKICSLCEAMLVFGESLDSNCNQYWLIASLGPSRICVQRETKVVVWIERLGTTRPTYQNESIGRFAECLEAYTSWGKAIECRTDITNDEINESVAELAASIREIDPHTLIGGRNFWTWLLEDLRV